MTQTQTPDPIHLDDIPDPVAREYLRVSIDRSGRERSIEEQNEENIRAAARRGWTLAEPYRETGSASRYQKKRRDEFDLLVSDLKAGRFGAHVLVLWEISRGSRQMGEWVAMLEDCQRLGVNIFATSERQTFDPNNPRDWKALMMAAVDAEFEVRQTSKRVKRSASAAAREGKWSGGRRPYGYEADGVTINEPEAKILRGMVKAVLGGRTVRSVATDLNRRGIPTASGKQWAPATVKKVVSSPRLAAKRTHNGVVVADAEWPPIISEAEHRNVVAVLASRTTVGRRGRTPWLLTGLLKCELCGSNLVANGTTGSRRYGCVIQPGQKKCGGVTIKADPLEEKILDLAMRKLADVDARSHAIGDASDEEDAAELVELEKITARLAELAVADLPVEVMVVAARKETDRRAEIEAARASRTSDSLLLDYVMAENYVGVRLHDLTDRDEIRSVLDALMGWIQIGPQKVRGSHRFEQERILHIEWKA